MVVPDKHQTHSIGFDGFGTPHKTLQTYQCLANDYNTLIKLLPNHKNPINKWANNNNHTPSSDDVTSWFPNNDQHVFYSSDLTVTAKQPLTYTMLQQLIQDFIPYDFNHQKDARQDTPSVAVVGLLLPPCMMAEMAVTLITLLAQHNKGICVAPIDPKLPNPKLLATLQHFQCTALITTNDLYNDKLKDHPISNTLMDIRTVQPSKTNPIVGVMDWTYVKQGPLTPATFNDTLKVQSTSGCTSRAKPAMFLSTSGTTSTPKIVPLTASALLYNATCIAASLDLGPGEVGCNAMPLFHIGGISCALLSVLVSGSSVVMMEGSFDSQAFLDVVSNEELQQAQPTWYYGVPSMHKTLILGAKARLAHSSQDYLPNKLKFIRSGAAHLPHDTAVELAKVFNTKVIPTYSMSECMPVCSCHDAPVYVVTGTEAKRIGVLENTVGYPIGCTMAIVDDDGEILEYGAVGEVALKGPGVIDKYIGIPVDKSHTPTGFFRTGDMGQLDRNGRLVLSGRQKEMIKRGGDQVWPNEVDNVVESVQGVHLAVSFGVPNELWGEEVQVAVVLKQEYRQHDKVKMAATIADVCTTRIGDAATPVQVHFIDSTDTLPKTATGKYRRTEMANHFGAKALDTGAMQALERMVDVGTVPFANRSVATPSTALNGVRFLVACFVVHIHVGLMPNNAWLRIQSFSFNMTIFFMLGAFQLACAVKTSVRDNAAMFIGTKIGSMQALFIISQFIALASYLLFTCGERGYAMEFEDESCTESVPYIIPGFVINTVSAVFGFLIDPTNAPAWFQGVFYVFLMLFPILDGHLRSKSRRYLGMVLVITLTIASLPYLTYVPESVLINFRFISWMPAMVAAMIAGYFFGQPKSSSSSSSSSWLSFTPRTWGIITDIVSIVFLILEILVARSPNSIYMKQEYFEVARPGEALPEDVFEVENGTTALFFPALEPATYVLAPDVTHEEFVEFVHSDPSNPSYGRWSTDLANVVGFGRLGSPLVLLWLFGLAHGHGFTAGIMNLPILQFLSPYAYPLYLFHIPIARFYWVLTRGRVAEFWWPVLGGYPVPVEWYELFFLIAICIVLAVVLDRFVVAPIMPYTIKAYIWIFQKCCCCCCCCPCTINNDNDPSSDIDGDNQERTTLHQMVHLVKGLTGNEHVTRATHLTDLGLDSLGATALLGTLRASIPAAKSLTLAKLARFDTMGDLIDFLEEERGTKPTRQEQAIESA